MCASCSTPPKHTCAQRRALHGLESALQAHPRSRTLAPSRPHPDRARGGPGRGCGTVGRLRLAQIGSHPKPEPLCLGSTEGHKVMQRSRRERSVRRQVAASEQQWGADAAWVGVAATSACRRGRIASVFPGHNKTPADPCAARKLSHGVPRVDHAPAARIDLLAPCSRTI